VSELLEAFRAGEGVDLIRESVRMVLQELIETEAATVIGAGRYERTPARVTERNGARERVLSTQAGDVSLRIPKLRQGAFFPVILEPGSDSRAGDRAPCTVDVDSGTAS
jgi:putative transposase